MMRATYIPGPVVVLVVLPPLLVLLPALPTTMPQIPQCELSHARA